MDINRLKFLTRGNRALLAKVRHAVLRHEDPLGDYMDERDVREALELLVALIDGVKV